MIIFTFAVKTIKLKMHLKLLLALIFVGDSAVSLARDLSTRDFIKLFNMLPRRNILEKDDDIIEMPKSVENLPRAEPIKPGHTLIQPSLGMLESAVKYPQKDVSGTAVYGNLKNLGLTYGNTNQRLSYGSFRKSNLVATLLKAIENIQKQSRNKRNPYAIIMEIDSGEYDKENKLHFADEKRHILQKDDIVEIPKSVEDLPRVGPFKYGKTLIQPLLGKLKSATKYPQRDFNGIDLYENKKNLGITFGNTNQRLSYDSFRKSKDLLTALLQAIGNIQKQSNERNSHAIVIEIDPTDVNQEKKYHFIDEKEPEIENDASEILDDSDSGEEGIVTRRKSNKRKNSKYRNRDSTASSSSETSSSSSDRSSDYESNPGNPFTVHKDKYKQNWLWNHFMDGDHMNVNPYAPQFSSGGPSGASLFFGRKWWYFNQDDFKPLQ